jgi:hypothetical protein
MSDLARRPIHSVGLGTDGVDYMLLEREPREDEQLKFPGGGSLPASVAFDVMFAGPPAYEGAPEVIFCTLVCRHAMALDKLQQRRASYDERVSIRLLNVNPAWHLQGTQGLRDLEAILRKAYEVVARNEAWAK